MKNSLPIVFIVLALGLFYVYLSPQYSNIKLLSSERANYDDILEKSVELRDLREQLRNKMQGFSSTDLNRLEKMIPQEVDPTQLILDLDNIARRYGIVMYDTNTEILGVSKNGKNNSDSESKSNDPYDTLSLSFNFTSSYENFVSFMADIESSLRIMDVSAVDITVDEEDPRQPNFEVTVK